VFNAGGVKRVFERLRQGSDFWQIFPGHTLVVCSNLEVTDKGLEKDCLPKPEIAHNTQFPLPPSECLSRCSDTEV